MQPSTRALLRKVLRGVVSTGMVYIGVLHFVKPEPFVRIMPSFLPAPLFLVQLSGFFEVLGGLGLLVPRTRKAASYGLVALYLAVFPANINQAVNHISFDDAKPIPPAVLWGRLPLQVGIIALALWVGKDDEEKQRA